MKIVKYCSIVFALLLMVGLLSAGQTVMAASGSGTSSSDPRVVDNFNDFKSAMEDWNIKYVKLESSGGCLPDVSSYTAAITVHGPNNLKTLTIEGASDFWCPLNGNYDSLIRVPNNVELTVNGTGTLKYGAGMKNAYNAVIRNDGACKISGVTLAGYNNGNTYGYAVVSNGTLTISSGTFSGITALDGSGPYAAVRIDSGTATISGGLFSSSIYGSVTVSVGTNALAVDSGATCVVTGGRFTSGIYVKGAYVSTILASGYSLVDASNNTVPTNQSRYNDWMTVVDDSVINTVDVLITEPKAGQTPKEGVSATSNVTVSLTEWSCGGTKLTSTDKFEAGKIYKVHVIVYSSSGYSFPTNPKVTFNGVKTGNIFLSGNDYINYYAEFSVPISDVDVSIQKPIHGQSPKEAVSATSNVTVSVTEWSCGGTKLTSTDKFEAGKTYRVHVIVYSNNGCTFATNPKVTFNGSIDGNIFLKGTDYINYYAEFTVPPISITSVSLKITEPKAGAKPDYTATFPSGVPYFSDAYNVGNYRNDIGWWNENTHNHVNPDSGVFQAGYQYKVSVYLTAQDGYAFTNSTTATLNGQPAEASMENGQLLIKYTFPKLTAITRGDLNKDGSINQKDLAMLSKYMRNKTLYPLDEYAMAAADINGDGSVNQKDLAILSKYMRNPTAYPLP